MSDATDTRVPLRRVVGKEVKVLLLRHDMTAAQLAKAIGRSEMYVSRRLRGETAFDLDDLEKIAPVLRVKLVDLLADRSAGSSPWYDRPVQTAIARTPDPATRRPRDGRPANRPSGPARPVDLPTVRRPQPRFATLPGTDQRVNAGRLPA